MQQRTLRPCWSFQSQLIYYKYHPAVNTHKALTDWLIDLATVGPHLLTADTAIWIVHSTNCILYITTLQHISTMLCYTLYYHTIWCLWNFHWKPLEWFATSQHKSSFPSPRSVLTMPRLVALPLGSNANCNIVLTCNHQGYNSALLL